MGECETWAAIRSQNCFKRQSAKQEKCMTLKSSAGGGFDFGMQMCKILYKSSLFLTEKSTFIYFYIYS